MSLITEGKAQDKQTERDFSDTSGTKTWARATCERSKRLEFRLGCIVF